MLYEEFIRINKERTKKLKKNHYLESQVKLTYDDILTFRDLYRFYTLSNEHITRLRYGLDFGKVLKERVKITAINNRMNKLEHNGYVQTIELLRYKTNTKVSTKYYLLTEKSIEILKDLNSIDKDFNYAFSFNRRKSAIEHDSMLNHFMIDLFQQGLIDRFIHSRFLTTWIIPAEQVEIVRQRGGQKIEEIENLRMTPDAYIHINKEDIQGHYFFEFDTGTATIESSLFNKFERYITYYRNGLGDDTLLFLTSTYKRQQNLVEKIENLFLQKFENNLDVLDYIAIGNMQNPYTYTRIVSKKSILL